MAALAGKTAIVTGAASGIGLAIARLYLDEGAQVVAADLEGTDLAAPFAGQGAARTLHVDVTAEDAPARLVDLAMSAFGGLDILVNNAGICLPGSIEDQSLESWERSFAVNVTAPFRIAQAAVPVMKPRAWGRIINMGSIMSDFGGPSLCAYGMSKHALAGLTKSMAVDLGGHGITVNYIQPSAIWTGMSRPFMDDPEFRTYWETKAPVGYIGEPEDVAGLARFLATDEARFINGAGLKVCGGAMIKF